MLDITLDEFQRRRDNKSTRVIDVLPPPCFRLGHIPGAVNLPVGEMPRDAWRVIPATNDEVIVYCDGFS